MTLKEKVNKYYETIKQTDDLYNEIWNELNLLKFNEEQIRQLKYGLEDGLDITVFANPNIKSSTMQLIKRILDNKRYYTEQEINDQINLLLIEN